MKNALFYAITFLALQFVAGQLVVLVGLLIGWQCSTAMLGLVSTILSSLATIVLFLRLKWAFAPRAFVESRPWGVLFWTAIASVGLVIPSLALQELMPVEWLPQSLQDDFKRSEQLITDMMGMRGGYFVICLLVPLAEELVFRGGILRTLLNWRPNAWAMIALSALIFAVVHLNPLQMPHAFLVGLLLGWMYWRTGSIVPGVVLHWINNTAAYLLWHAYPDPDIRLIDIMSGEQRGVWVAVISSLAILLPALYQLHLRMKR